MRTLRLAAAACAVLLIGFAPVLFALFVAPRIVRPAVILEPAGDCMPSVSEDRAEWPTT
jgi:hypothetical protein